MTKTDERKIERMQEKVEEMIEELDEMIEDLESAMEGIEERAGDRESGEMTAREQERYDQLESDLNELNDLRDDLDNLDFDRF